MTGYGNFSYFYKYNDFSPWRVCKMLFRLNFLVLMILMVMNTDYMLYYICPMHTLWFLSVYVRFLYVDSTRTLTRLLHIPCIVAPPSVSSLSLPHYDSSV